MAEKDYLEIARRKVNRPRGIKTYRRIFVYGRNKKGKTRFSLSAGIAKTLLLDPEKGTDTMLRLNPYRWPITKWEDVNEAYLALRTGRLSPKTLGLGPEEEPFDWLSVDGLTRMHNMSLKYVGRVAEDRDLNRIPGMVSQPDYNKAGELTKEMLLKFHALPMNVIYTAQERFVTTEGDDELGESTTFYVADLPQGARGAVNSIVEVIGRIYTTRVQVKIKGGGTKQKLQRRLWVGDHASFDTGFRSDFELPEFIRNPTLTKLVNLMLSGSEEGD